MKCVGTSAGCAGIRELLALCDGVTVSSEGIGTWGGLLFRLFAGASNGSTGEYGGGGASSWSILRVVGSGENQEQRVSSGLGRAANGLSDLDLHAVIR